MKTKLLFLVLSIFTLSTISKVDENQTGAWYMYFFNHKFLGLQFGIQGDGQNTAFLNDVIHNNALITVKDIKERSPKMAQLESEVKLKL